MRKIKVKCMETGTIFESQRAASKWLYHNAYTVAQLDNINNILCKMVNGTKIKISGKGKKPRYGNVKTVLGYTFKKV